MGTVCSAQFYDVAEDSMYAPSINLLADCGIVCGSGDGTFSPYDLVTRAQTAKMAVIMTDLAEVSGGSLFADVPQGFWGTGYINAAAQAGIFTGYANGCFGPEDNLTYAQAITVALRMLGYNSTNIKGSYPSAYIAKAAALGLTDGLNFNPDSAVNRQNTAYIFANALTADKAGGGKLAEDMKCTVSDECTVLADYQNAEDEILTSSGTYRYSGDKDYYIGKRVKLIIDSSNAVKGIIPTGAEVKRAVIAGISGNEITVIDNGALETIQAAGSALIYFEGSGTSYNAVRTELCAGDMLYYTSAADGSLSSGVVGINDKVTAMPVSEVSLEGYTAVKNSALCTAFEDEDIAYVYPSEKAAVIFDTKVSGILSAARPTKNSADTITVSGTDYKTATQLIRTQLKDISVNDTVTVLLGRNNDAVAIYSASSLGKVYGIASITGNDITCVGAGGRTVLKMTNTSRVIYKGSDTTYGAVRDSLGENMQITVFSRDGEYDYSVIDECELSDPVIAVSAGVNPFSGADTVIRDGKIASASDIAVNDVLYYSSALNTVYAYCDSVLGVYEKALPDKQNPTSIKLSGVEYGIETASAVSALSSVPYDSYITILLGREGRIAGISRSAGTSSDTSSYGAALACSKKTVDGKADYYLTCLSANGAVQDFKVKSDLADVVGKPVQYRFEGEYMTPSTLKNSAVSGAVDKQNRKIGTWYLSEDCKIIDISYVSGADEAAAQCVELSDISKLSLSADDILAAASNKDGDICFLALNDITLFDYSFGVVTGLGGSAANGYKIDCGGETKTYQSDVNISAGLGKGVMFRLSGGKIADMKVLYSACSGSVPVSINAQRIKTSTKNVDIAKNAAVYIKTAEGKYLITDINDLDNSTVSSVTAYTDINPDFGGKAYVVIVTVKGK